jgi:hypothetical protein
MTCGRRWPCSVARDQLAVSFRSWPLTLTVYMAGQYMAAVEDHVAAFDESVDLRDRMLGWARRTVHSWRVDA